MGYQMIMHALWILGLGLLLASLSYHRYTALQSRTNLLRQLSGHTFQFTFYVSLLLVGLGLAGTSPTIWEAGIWLVLATAAAAGSLYYRPSKNSRSVHPRERHEALDSE